MLSAHQASLALSPSDLQYPTYKTLIGGSFVEDASVGSMGYILAEVFQGDLVDSNFLKDGLASGLSLSSMELISAYIYWVASPSSARIQISPVKVNSVVRPRAIDPFDGAQGWFSNSAVGCYVVTDSLNLCTYLIVSPPVLHSLVDEDPDGSSVDFLKGEVLLTLSVGVLVVNIENFKSSSWFSGLTSSIANSIKVNRLSVDKVPIHLAQPWKCSVFTLMGFADFLVFLSSMPMLVIQETLHQVLTQN